MKKRINLIIIFTLFVLIFLFLTKIVCPKYATEYIEGNMISEYYKEQKKNDVIFIGDCEVYANYSPLVMYEQDGITSYIRGTSQQLIWQSYYILRETFNYEIPKVVVLNVNSMRYSQPISEAYNRMTIDKMKWSKEKVNIIKSSMTDEESFLSYIFPILRYHSRITELTKEDFKYLFKGSNNTFNGFLINKEIVPLSTLPTKKTLNNYKFDDIDYEYLEKIYQLCKDNNVQLLLVKAPSLYPYWYEEYNDQIVEFAKSKDINYINLIDNIEEIGIDYSTDTYDGGLHLNLYGATKLSEFFSKYLKENYDLTDYRNNKYVDLIYQKKLSEYKKEIGD